MSGSIEKINSPAVWQRSFNGAIITRLEQTQAVARHSKVEDGLANELNLVSGGPPKLAFGKSSYAAAAGAQNADSARYFPVDAEATGGRTR